VVEVGQLHAGHFRQVGNALHGGQAGAALQSGGKHFGQQLDAAVRGDARRRQQARFAQRPATQQQGALAARSGWPARCLPRLHSWLAPQVSARRRARLATVAPGHVGGQDQRGHLAGQTARRTDGVGVLAQLRWCCEVRTKPGETLRATVSMSDCSCASYCVWWWRGRRRC
jgi:hypothetical protein